MSVYIPSTTIAATETWCYSQFPTFNQVFNDLAGYMPIVGGTFSGGVTFDGSIQLGSGSSIIPSISNNADLGSSIKYINNGYINNLFVNNEVVNNTTINNNSLIELNASDTANANIGLIFDVTSSLWSGMFKDGTTGHYKLIDGMNSKPTSSTTLSAGNGNLDLFGLSVTNIDSTGSLIFG